MIAKVEFYSGANLLASVSTAPYSTSWMNAAVGSHSLTAKATDSQQNRKRGQARINRGLTGGGQPDIRQPGADREARLEGANLIVDPGIGYAGL